jgi:hypothetical protein
MSSRKVNKYRDESFDAPKDFNNSDVFSSDFGNNTMLRDLKDVKNSSASNMRTTASHIS